MVAEVSDKFFFMIALIKLNKLLYKNNNIRKIDITLLGKKIVQKFHKEGCQVIATNFSKKHLVNKNNLEYYNLI